MSIKSRAEPPLQVTAADHQNKDSATTTDTRSYSSLSLSVRGRYDHAIPTGTVASRIRNLQNLQRGGGTADGFAAPSFSSDLYTSTQAGTPSGRSSSTRRVSNDALAPRPKSKLGLNLGTHPSSNHHGTSYTELPYSGIPRSRSTYRGNHAISPRKSSVPRSKAGTGTGPTATQKPQTMRSPQRGTSASKSIEKGRVRDLSAYKTALSDYSRQEIDRITEVDSSHDVKERSVNTIVSATVPQRNDTTRVISEEQSYLSENTDVTTSTTRRESVRELFHDYGIERPHGLVSSTDASVIGSDEILKSGGLPLKTSSSDAGSHESKQKDAPPVRTPIADSFMERRGSQDFFRQPSRPPTPPPLPPPRGSSSGRSDSTRSDKHRNPSIKAKKNHGDHLIVAERLRHEKAREELSLHQIDSIQKDGSSGSKVSKRSKPTVDDPASHTNHSPDNLTRMIVREARLQKKAMAPEPLKQNDSRQRHMDESLKNLRVNPGSIPIRNYSPAKQNVGSANIDHLKGYSGDVDTPHTQKFLTPLEAPASGYFFSHEKKKHETRPQSHSRPNSQLQTRESTDELVPPIHSSPLAKQPHHSHSKRGYSKIDPVSPLTKQNNEVSEKMDITPKPLATIPKRNQIRVEKQDRGRVREPRRSKSDYVTSFETHSPSAAPQEDFSFIVGQPDIITGRTGMQSPIITQNPHHQEQQDHGDSYYGYHDVSSGSVSRSIETPLPPSECESETCRATHSGHAPYRHSISCTEKRRNRPDFGGEVGHHGKGLSADHHYAELHLDPSASPRSVKHHRPKPLPHQQITEYPSSRCQYCSGNLDRCRHYCRDDCQCDNCQGLIHFTRQYVLAEQEKRKSKQKHKISQQEKHERDRVMVDDSRGVESNHTSTAISEKPPIKVPERFRRTEQMESSQLSSEPVSFTSAAGPVYSPTPQRKGSRPPSWTRSPGLETKYQQKPVIKPSGLPESKSWKAQRQRLKPRSRSVSPQKNRGDLGGKGKDPVYPSTEIVLSPGSRLPFSTRNDLDRKPSIQKAPSISKILTQHHTAEIRAPTPPPWSPESRDVQIKSRGRLPRADKPRSSSLVAVTYQSPVSPDPGTVSPRTPRKSTADPTIKAERPTTRSISEELQKHARSICPPRIPVRRNPQNGKQEGLASSPSKITGDVPSRPHTSMGRIDSVSVSPRLDRSAFMSPSEFGSASFPSRSISPVTETKDAQGQQKKVSRRLSTLFLLRDKKSPTPSSPLVSPSASENEVDKKKTKRSGRLKKIESEEMQERSRKWSSLKLVARKDEDKEAYEEDLGLVNEEQGERERDSGSQDWSRSGKGHISSPGIGVVDSSTEKSKELGQKEDEESQKRDQRKRPSPTILLRNRNQTGLVSSKVEKWNQELAATRMMDSSSRVLSNSSFLVEKEKEKHECVWKNRYWDAVEKKDREKGNGRGEVVGVTVRVHFNGERGDVVFEGVKRVDE